MSWLYTLVFAGLMLSSDSDLQTFKSHNHNESAKLIAAAPPEETEKFEQTYPLNANGRVSVANVNGSITITTWERSEVRLEYVKTADTKENLAEVGVRIDARQDAFSVETDYGDWNRRSAGKRRSYELQVEYRLTVPRAAVLNEIETVNGTISIANAGNLTKASAVNGEVKAVNLRGTANLSTVNGTVVADFDQLSAGSKITLETVNGTVNLIMPSDVNATIKAETVNGTISNDFGLPVRKGQYVGRDLYGRVGSGDVQIRLNSVNGGLSVNRKNDGKTISPATDLLNLKSEDDEDWEDADAENTSGIRPPKSPKAPKPPKAPKISLPPLPPLPPAISEVDNEAIRQSVEDAMREAGLELAKIQPELEKINADAIRIDSEQMQKQIKEAQAIYAEAAKRGFEGYRTIGSPVIEKKSGSFAVKGTPKVTVETKDCAVIVRGWDKPEISYSAVRIARAGGKSVNEEWTTSATKTNESDVSFKVFSTVKPDNANFEDATKVRLEIFVPKKTDLKITTNGEIRLEGISGEIDLTGVDEAINVRDADGKLTVGTADGRIRVIGFRGAFDGRTADGVMNLEGDFQSFNALATDGTIVLTLPENSNADLESNAEIESDGVNLIRGDAKTKSWRVGKGGKVFRMAVQNGKVIVRSANSVSVN